MRNAFHGGISVFFLCVVTSAVRKLPREKRGWEWKRARVAMVFVFSREGSRLMA